MKKFYIAKPDLDLLKVVQSLMAQNDINNKFLKLGMESYILTEVTPKMGIAPNDGSHIIYQLDKGLIEVYAKDEKRPLPDYQPSAEAPEKPAQADESKLDLETKAEETPVENTEEKV